MNIVVLASSAEQSDSGMHIHGSILFKILFPFRLSSIIQNSASLAQAVKKLPAIRETWVQSLGWEDPLEKEWPPTLAFLPGEAHGQRSLEGYSPCGHKESDMAERLTLYYLTENRKTPSLLRLSPSPSFTVSSAIKSSDMIAFVYLFTHNPTRL